MIGQSLSVPGTGMTCICKKVVPYLIMSVEHGADPGFLTVSPHVT